MRTLFIISIFSIGIGLGMDIEIIKDYVIDLKGVPIKINLLEEGIIKFYRDGKEVLQIHSDKIKTQVINKNCTFLKRLNKDTIRLSCNVETDISNKVKWDNEGTIKFGPDNIIDCTKNDCGDLFFNYNSLNQDTITLEWPPKSYGYLLN